MVVIAAMHKNINAIFMFCAVYSAVNIKEQKLFFLHGFLSCLFGSEPPTARSFRWQSFLSLKWTKVDS